MKVRKNKAKDISTRALAVLAVATIAGGFWHESRASANTYTWTRAGTNNNWDNNTNWLTGSGIGAPPVTPAVGTTTDIVYAGTQANTSSSMRQDYTIDSLTFGPTFTVTATFNLNAASTLLNTNTTSAHLTIGAGGITSNVTTFNIAISSNTATPNAELRLSANQTWFTGAPAAGSGAITFTIARSISGTANVTKTGPGVLVLQSNNNVGWSGGLNLVEGSVRTGGAQGGPNGQFGTGPISSLSANDVTITASTVSGSGGGGDRIFDNSLILGGTGRLTLGGSFNMNFTAASTWTLQADKKLGISFVTDHAGTITGPGALLKYGQGTLVLNNSSSYGGATSIVEGEIRVRNASALGTGSAGVTVVAADGVTNTLGGSLELENVSVSGKPLTISGNGVQSTNAQNQAIGAVAQGGAVRNFAGNNTWSGPVTLSGSSATVRLDAGSLNFSGGVSGAGSSSLNVTSVSTGTVKVDHIRLGGNVTLSDGTKMVVTSTDPVAGVSKLGNVVANGSSTLDLAVNDLILTGIDLGTATGLVTGGKVISSAAGTATGDPRSLVAALGIISNSGAAGTAYYSSFDGQPVNSSDVLIKYTYRGDTNLDGKLDGTDIANIVEGISTGASGWMNGDINYDGVVDNTDWGLFQGALAAYSTPFAGGGAGHVDDGGHVPEPGVAVGLGAAAILVSRRRRQ